jgi:hypothetical protein
MFENQYEYYLKVCCFCELSMDTLLAPNNRIDDCLHQLMIETMNTEEQHLFVKSFETYLQYGDDDTAFAIDLDNVWEWMGFSRKDHAKRLLTKSFSQDIHYTETSLPFRGEQSATGGQNKEIIMMTVNTFKKFCMKASTKKADQVCDYYLKMENIMLQYTKEQINNQNQLLIEMKTAVQDAENNTELERQRILLQTNDKKNVVYVMKVQVFENGSFIIKIGESGDIKDRIQKISANIGTPALLIDVFPCKNNYKFEQFLLHHPKLLLLKYNDLINNKIKSSEVFLMQDLNMYHMIKRFIKKNIHSYNHDDTENQRLCVAEKLCKIFENNQDGLMKALKLLFADQKTLIPLEPDESVDVSHVTNVDIEASSSITNDIEASSLSTDDIEASNTNDNAASSSSTNDIGSSSHVANDSVKLYGPRVQIYDENDLSRVLRVFEGITEATRLVEKSSFTQIKFVARERLGYLGYRWFLVDRNDSDPDKARDIGETVSSIQRRTGLIAMLNLDKSCVLKVFQDQKGAAEYASQHASAMCTAVKYTRPLNGYYWALWDDLDHDMKETFQDEIPQKKYTSRGVRVQKIDPETDEIIETFPSISDAVKKEQISPKTIKTAALNGSIQKYKWKIL